MDSVDEPMKNKGQVVKTPAVRLAAFAKASEAPAVYGFPRLDLELAWRRVCLDRPYRCFVLHPYLISWIEANTAGWLAGIAKNLQVGYVPEDAHSGRRVRSIPNFRIL